MDRYENESHSSLVDTRKKRTFALKLVGYCLGSDIEDLLFSIKDYFNTCDTFPLKMGEGLAGKTFETYEAHFCKDINELSDNGLLSSLPANNKCSCITIFLRSLHTEIMLIMCSSSCGPKTVTILSCWSQCS